MAYKNNSMGAVGCQSCPNGSTTYLNGSYACVPCAAGSYGPSGVCLPCAAGSYSISVGSTTCAPCWPGTFSTGAGGTSCASCGVGTFSNTTGLTACATCTSPLSPRGLPSEGFANTTRQVLYGSLFGHSLAPSLVLSLATPLV